MFIFLLIICLACLLGAIDFYSDYEYYNALFLFIVSIGTLLYLIKIIIDDVNNWLFKIGNPNDNVYTYNACNNNNVYSPINKQKEETKVVSMITTSNNDIKTHQINVNNKTTKPNILKSIGEHSKITSLVTTQKKSTVNVISEKPKTNNENSKTTYIFVSNKHELSNEQKLIYDSIISFYIDNKYTDNVIKDYISRFKYIDIFGGGANIYVHGLKQIFHLEQIKELISKNTKINIDKINFIEYNYIELIDYYNKLKIKENEHNYTSDC